MPQTTARRCWLSPDGEVTLWVDPRDLDTDTLRDAIAYPSQFAPTAYLRACMTELGRRTSQKG